MTKDQLARWKSMGFPFDEFYDTIAKEAPAVDGGENKILSVDVKRNSKESEREQEYLVSIALTSMLHNNTRIEVEVDGKFFQAYQQSDSLQNLNRYNALVSLTLPIPFVAKKYPLKVSVIDVFLKKVADSKVVEIEMKEDKNDEENNSECNKCSVDRKYFFEQYKVQFKKINNSQINGLNTIFDSICNYYKSENRDCLKNHLSYILATIKHETADTFKPINEYGGIKYYEEMYDPVLGKNEKRRKMAVDNENTELGDGVKYHGRGFVQITWKKNYRKMAEKFEIDLINYPEKTLDIELAVKILLYGSESGVFTGLKLSDYLSPSKNDYYNARRVINGVDKAELIKEYAIKIEKCIKVNEK